MSSHCYLCRLRYESEKSNEVQALTNALAKRGIPSEELQVIKLLREYAGEKQRSLDIFKNKTWIDIARGQIKRGLTVCTFPSPSLSFSFLSSFSFSYLSKVPNHFVSSLISYHTFPLLFFVFCFLSWGAVGSNKYLCTMGASLKTNFVRCDSGQVVRSHLPVSGGQPKRQVPSLFFHFVHFVFALF